MAKDVNLKFPAPKFVLLGVLTPEHHISSSRPQKALPWPKLRHVSCRALTLVHQLFTVRYDNNKQEAQLPQLETAPQLPKWGLALQPLPLCSLDTPMPAVESETRSKRTSSVLSTKCLNRLFPPPNLHFLGVFALTPCRSETPKILKPKLD